MKRSNFLALLLLTAAVSPLATFAADTFVEGEDYVKLAAPVRVADPKKIELAEAFSYACPHCFHFESLLEPYVAALPDDVNFVPTHIRWDRTTENLARAMYTAQALNVFDKMHSAMFQAIQVQRKRVQSEDDIKAIFVAQGVDADAFKNTFNSFGVNSQVKQADARIRGYKVNATPTLIVNGEYVISATVKNTHERMLEVATFLINKTRDEKGG